MNNNAIKFNGNIDMSGDLTIKNENYKYSINGENIKKVGFLHMIERVEKLEKYVLEQKLKSVKKQYDKIVKDPSDIKMVDVEEVLEYKNDLILTPELESMYEVIEKWYSENK